MKDLSGKRIAILATHGFEQSELLVPHRKLRDMGAEVHVVSPAGGQIRGWDHDHWDAEVTVDRRLADATVEDYDTLVLPGGQMNPDTLRAVPEAVAFVRDFAASGKPVAAICHGPWLLVEAGLAKGRHLTSYKSIRTDMVNAGAEWEDREVVVDNGMITSRNPGDLDAFVDKIAEETLEGRHARRGVA